MVTSRATALSLVALVLGGLSAGWALLAYGTMFGTSFGTGRVDFAFVVGRSMTTVDHLVGGSVAIVVAVGIVWLLSGRSRLPHVVAFVVGALLVGIVLPVANTMFDQPVRVLLGGVCVGVLLGALAVMAAGSSVRTGALALGLLAPLLASGLWDSGPFSALGEGVPRRYADYLPESQNISVGWDPTVSAVVLAVALVCGVLALWFGPAASTAVSGRTAAICVAVPVVAFVIATATDALPAGTLASVIAIGVTVGAALWAARVVPGQDGAILLGAVSALVAVTAAGASSLTTDTYEDVGALVTVVALAAGLLAGVKTASPIVGTVAAAVAVVLAVVGPDSITSTVTAIVVTPFAVGAVIGGCLPASPLTTATGLLLPMSFTAFATAPTLQADFGWTAYTPLTDAVNVDFDPFPDTPTWLAATIYVVVILLCGWQIRSIRSRA